MSIWSPCLPDVDSNQKQVKTREFQAKVVLMIAKGQYINGLPTWLPFVGNYRTFLANQTMEFALFEGFM